MKVRRSFMLSVTSLMTALTTVLTIIIQIPVPQTKGYINLGDAMVMLSGALFGPLVGFVAGGVGSALADIVSGYAHWAPFTLLIKGFEGLVVGIFAEKKGLPCLGWNTPRRSRNVSGLFPSRDNAIWPWSSPSRATRQHFPGIIWDPCSKHSVEGPF